MATCNKTKCPLCSEDVSKAGFRHHIHSRAHATELADKIKSLAPKYCQEAWKSLPYFWAKEKQYFVCLGCKLAKQFPDSDHLRSCPQAKEHRAALKKIAEEANIPLEVAGGNEELEKRVKDLEARLKKKTKEVDAAEEKLVEQTEEEEKRLAEVMGMSYIEALDYIDEQRCSDAGLKSYKELLDEVERLRVEVLRKVDPPPKSTPPPAAVIPLLPSLPSPPEVKGGLVPETPSGPKVLSSTKKFKIIQKKPDNPFSALSVEQLQGMASSVRPDQQEAFFEAYSAKMALKNASYR